MYLLVGDPGLILGRLCEQDIWIDVLWHLAGPSTMDEARALKLQQNTP